MTKTYQVWRTTNNPYGSFILGVNPTLKTAVTNLIDKKFKRYYIFTDDDEFMLDETEVVLGSITHEFEKMLLYETELSWDEFFGRNKAEKYNSEFNRHNESVYKGNSERTSNGNTNTRDDMTSNSERNYTDKTTTNGSTSGNDTSSTKSKGLASAYPNSNVSADISMDLDSPVSWKFATNSNDGSTKAESNSSSTSNNTSNTTGNARDTSTNNSTSNVTSTDTDNSTTNNTNNGDANGNTNYTRDIVETDPEYYIKMLNALNKGKSAMDWLFKRMSVLFDYRMEGKF